MIDPTMDTEEALDEMEMMEIEMVLKNLAMVLILMMVMALGETRERDQRPLSDLPLGLLLGHLRQWMLL
jgi:hypothetical protein